MIIYVWTVGVGVVTSECMQSLDLFLLRSSDSQMIVERVPCGAT